MNEYQKKRFCDNIVNTMVNIKNKKIAILGFAYKSDTSDARESPAIEICKTLLDEGGKLAIYDPQVYQGGRARGMEREKCWWSRIT
eukprot:607349-Hanusia_phi.AAC.5